MVSSRDTSDRCGPRPPLAFSIAEQEYLLGVLDRERFADTAPATIYATLLDEGHYYGSVRTMYRLPAANSQVGERRRQRRHPVHTKPELLAIRPNEVWSWDISKLKGPAKWTCLHDIFSRYVVGWMIAHREAAELAEQLIAETIDKQKIVPGTQTLHADRGTSMRSKSVAQLLGWKNTFAGRKSRTMKESRSASTPRRRPASGQSLTLLPLRDDRFSAGKVRGAFAPCVVLRQFTEERAAP